MNRYPLTWPEGWRRVPAARRATALFRNGRERISVAVGVSRVLHELRLFGVGTEDSILSTNVRTRLDGLPRSDQPEPEDPGAAVYWERAGERGHKVMAIDIYNRVGDNLAAIAATLEAMRAIERHGGAQILERAFTGFTALPGPGQISRHWRQVLELKPDSKVDQAAVLAAYRRLASVRHPDHQGGSHAAMAELNLARDQAVLEAGP